MSESGQDVSLVPAPTGTGRGRPIKVRPRENEAGNRRGIGAEVKRRRKSSTAGGETGGLVAGATGAVDENETNLVELKDPDYPVTRSGARSEKHPMNRQKKNAVNIGGSDGQIGLVHEQDNEGENQEEEKNTALDVVLKVHGVCAQAIEGAAAFPGETGQEIGGHVHLCECCMKPEVSNLTLVCDGCERSFHITCLKLALQSASELDDWLCTSCSAAYPESEVAAGVSMSIREDIERKLFSQGKKTRGDEVVQFDLGGTVCSDLGDNKSVVVVTPSSERIMQDLNQTYGRNVIVGDQHRRDSPNHGALPERPLLDLNEANDTAVEGSLRGNLGIDLNESRVPEFEEEVLKVDESSKSPKAEVGAVNDITLPDERERCTNSTDTGLEQIDFKTIEASEKVQRPTTEEPSGVSDVKFAAAAGSFDFLYAEVPRNVGESCESIAEATSMVEAKRLGTLGECVITDASSSALAELTVDSEKKLTVTSIAEEFAIVADSNPMTSEESNTRIENRLAVMSSEVTGENQGKFAGHSVGGQITPVVDMKPVESPEEREILSTSRLVIPSAKLTAAHEINQACTVAAETNADIVTVESGRFMSVDSQEVDARRIGMLQGAADLGNCTIADGLGQDGKVSTTKNSDKKEKLARKNGSKLLEHFQEGILAKPDISGERTEISEPEAASHNALPTFNVVASSTSFADVVSVQPEGQQSKKAANKIASPVRYADVGLNGSLAWKPTQEISPYGPDDQQLKKIGADTLQQLKDCIREKHGLMLADGWEVEVRRRRTEKHLDKYYISPEKHRFRSRIEVMKHLGLWDGLKCGLQDGVKGKCEVQQSQSQELPNMVQRVAGGNGDLQLPLKLGDLTVESLGVIDLRPGYWDELHIWPVGYRCSWHDRTTSSFCVSEVAEGGSSAPVFRVTRKYSPKIVGPGDSNGNINSGSSDMGMKELQTVREDIMTASVNRMSSCSRRAKSHFGSGFDVEEEESLKPLLGGIAPISSDVHYDKVKFCPDGRNLGEISKIGTEGVSENCDGSEPRDVIGEFAVEAFSTAEVWKLYAEQFLERCPNVADVFGYTMKPGHHTTETVGPLPREVPDPKDLLEKLGEDRFGLEQPLVIVLIENLPNSEKCSGYKFLKQRGLSWKAADPVEVIVQPPRLRIREKARKQKKALEVLVEERVVASEPIEFIGKNEVDARSSVGERPPPPPGRSLELRLPSQYVGDVLQIWEFLSRFSNLIGFSQPPALEDLEEGLTCWPTSARGCADQSDSLHVRSELSADNRKTGCDGWRDVGRDVEVPHAAPRSTKCEATGSPQTPMKNLLPGRTNLANSMHGPQQKDMERRWEDDGTAVGSPSNDTNSLVDMEPNHNKGETLSADVYCRSSDAKLMDEPGFALAASVHVPLVKFLVDDLQSKVCGFEELLGESEESKHRRGRKRIRDILANASLGREKLIGSFSVNELTWPEVARRYMISLSRITEIGETSEYRREECMKILRCIQGDGGVLCGALDGVAGMEIDAQLLAEAEKEISTLMLVHEETAAPTTPPQNSLSRRPVEDARDEDSSGDSALWVKLLDPIAKLPTNVGSRIRNRVIDALAANPPAWAAEILEYSISKQVYKGNASGPTKRAVMEVLQRYRGQDPDPKVKKTKKQRKRVLPSPEVVMQRCRIVLRQVATADTLRVVSKSYRCMTNFYESEGEGLLARPLDFRAIDLRLGAGAYGTSADAFAADVKQILKNVASLNENGNVEASAAIQLAELFQTLYNKQVIVFQRGGDQAASTGPGEKIDGLSNEESKKNATEENPPGSDANKPVKAPWEDDSCQVCGIDDDHDNVLLCDGCDAEYHIYCLNPPLAEVPEGNWFCHSCVAVDTGFLEPQSAPESAPETKVPEKQDEHHTIRGRYLEETAEKDQLRKLDGSTNSVVRGIVMKLAETDYWHLTLAERVHLLKWLCDQALETPKVRSHLEKSMEVALDLQQQLRTLMAERRRNADLDEARPESSKEGTREVSILSVLQSRGAISKRPDEYDEEISVQVDVVDGLPVSSLGTSAVGTSKVLQSDPTELVGAEQHADVGTGMDTLEKLSYSLVEAEHSRADHEQRAIASDYSRHIPVPDPMEVDLPSSAVTRSCGQLKEGSGEGTRNLNREGNSETDDLNVVYTSEVHFVGRNRKYVGDNARSKPHIVVEPRNLVTALDEALESSRKCMKDEPFCGPEVEIEIEDSTLQRNTGNSLDAEIEKMKTKLMLVNSRRDLLGRDDVGRMYWALCGSKTTPWLAVETADGQIENQEELAARSEGNLALDGSAGFPSAEKLEKDDVSTNRDQCSRLDGSSDASPTGTGNKEEEVVLSNKVQKRPRDGLSWFIYTSEAGLHQLIEWLSPASNQERLLKATLLQWKGLLLLYRNGGAEQAGGLRGDFFSPLRGRSDGSKTTNTQALAPDVHSRRCVMPVLRASSLLEWKHGQYSDSLVKVSSTSAGSKRGRKRKAQQTSKISRCDCLEPLWPPRGHCTLCHTTYESEVEFLAHTTGGSCSNGGGKSFDQHGDGRAGKMPCHRSLSLTKSRKSAPPRQPPAGILAPPDVSKMPMVVHESLRDRINKIGFIGDKGPLFAPGLAVSPAFDPSLMMVDSLPTSPVKAGILGSTRGILGTVAVGATSCINHGGENLVNGCRILVSSSENLPGRPIAEADGAEAVDTADRANGRSSVSTAGSLVPAHAGPSSLEVQARTTEEENRFEHNQSAVSAPNLGRTMPGAFGLSHEPNGHPSQYKGYCKIFKVTGKQLTIPEASLRPLDAEEDLDVLQQLKVKLLDIEAAVTLDMSENARAYPRRRRAWRSMVKLAKSIYTVVQAIILLEQMISADFLRTSWCYWSSFTVAAKTATLSSLCLRVYALDAAIAYEKSQNYEGADLTNRGGKEGKQEKEREEKKNWQPKPPRKKKKEDVVVFS